MLDDGCGGGVARGAVGVWYLVFLIFDFWSPQKSCDILLYDQTNRKSVCVCGCGVDV